MSRRRQGRAPAGDITRGIGPFRNPGMGHFFLGANRNKRNLVLDLKDARARDALMKVAANSDVVITSVRPAAMARLGLAYEDFVAVRPDIIYVAGRLRARWSVRCTARVRRCHPGDVRHGRHAGRTKRRSSDGQSIHL